MAPPKLSAPSPSLPPSPPASAPSNPPPLPLPTPSTTTQLPHDLHARVVSRALSLPVENFANMGAGILHELGYLDPTRYLNIRDLGLSIRSRILSTPTSLTPWALNLTRHLNTTLGHFDPPTIITLLCRYATALHLESLATPPETHAPAPLVRINPEEGD